MAFADHNRAAITVIQSALKRSDAFKGYAENENEELSAHVHLPVLPASRTGAHRKPTSPLISHTADRR